MIEVIEQSPGSGKTGKINTRRRNQPVTLGFNRAERPPNTGELELKELLVFPGDTIEVDVSERQWDIISSMYELLEQDFSGMSQSESSRKLLEKIKSIFNPNHSTTHQEVTVGMIAEVRQLIKQQLDLDSENPNYLVADLLLEKLSKNSGTEILKVVETIGTGTTGVVVRLEKKREPMTKEGYQEIQEKLLWGLYEELMPGITPQNFDQLQDEKPDHLVFEIAQAFKSKNTGRYDLVTPLTLDHAREMIEHRLSENPDDQRLNQAHSLLLKLAKPIEYYNSLTDTGKSPIYKILYPLSGRIDDRYKALHIRKVAERINKLPLSITSSIALAKNYYQAKVNKQDGEIITTIIELEEAPRGIKLSKWHPRNKAEFVTVVSQITNITEAFHRAGIYNIDFDDPFINPEKLNSHIANPAELDNSYIQYYDTDECVTVQGSEVEMPILLEPEFDYLGKYKHMNYMLIKRRVDKPLSIRAAEYVDAHNIMVHLFNLFIKGTNLDYIASRDVREGGCHFQMVLDTGVFNANGFFASANNFMAAPEYPLIDFKTFKERMIFDTPNAHLIYRHFKEFFDAYHKATLANSLTNVIPDAPDKIENRLKIIIGLIKSKDAVLKETLS